MGNNEQHPAETSKAVNKRLKKQNLAALAAVRAHQDNIGGIKINETLHSLNCAVRRSPRKHGEIPPPPVNPHYNLAPSTNFTSPNSPNHFNSTNSPNHFNPTNTEPFVAECIRSEETRKKRGRTMLKSFSLTPNEKANVEFNEFGQPIGPNSKHLSSYLGVLAREMVHVTIPDWRKVNKTLKDDLWTCIRRRRALEEWMGKLLSDIDISRSASVVM